MRQLQTVARWDALVPKPHTFRDSHVLIYFLNIRSLPWHKIYVFSYYNLKIIHIISQWNTFNTFNTLTSNNTFLNIDTRTHSMININGRNGTMIIYDNFTTLSSHETFTLLEAEYIAATFDANTRKAIHIITIYKPSTLSLSMFIIHLQKFLNLMPISCPMIIICDFNIYSKLNTTKWTPKFYGPIFNQTSILKKYNNLWIPYWSRMDKCTHSTMHVKSYWSLLD